jgi:hypothetical protein
MNNSFTPPGGGHLTGLFLLHALLHFHITELIQSLKYPDYMVLADAGSIPAAASIFNMIFLVKNTQVNGLTSS